MKPSRKKDQQEQKGLNWVHTENNLKDNDALKRQVHSSDSATWPDHISWDILKHWQRKAVWVYVAPNQKLWGVTPNTEHTTIPNRKDLWIIQHIAAMASLLQIIETQLPDALLGVWWDDLQSCKPCPQLRPLLQFVALHLKAHQVLTREPDAVYPQPPIQTLCGHVCFRTQNFLDVCTCAPKRHILYMM